MKYEVLSPLNHDNRVYAVGSILELPEDSADSLIAVGVLKPILTGVAIAEKLVETAVIEDRKRKKSEVHNGN